MRTKDIDSMRNYNTDTSSLFRSKDCGYMSSTCGIPIKCKQIPAKLYEIQISKIKLFLLCLFFFDWGRGVGFVGVHVYAHLMF